MQNQLIWPPPCAKLGLKPGNNIATIKYKNFSTGVIKMRSPMKDPYQPKKTWSPSKEFLPIILGKEFSEELEDEELAKIELFEKGLANELAKEDTIAQAISKIVKMALAAEFGASIVAAKGAQAMIETIVGGITADAELRKQALIIIDRFAQQKDSLKKNWCLLF